MKNRTEFIHLSMKGERSYLHGTDILYALIGLTGKCQDLSFNIHKLSSKVLRAQVVSESDVSTLRSSGELRALMIYNQSSQRKIIAVTETIEPITVRVPYNEENIIKGAEITDRKIIHNFPQEGNSIQRIVALNKKLLNSVFEIHGWILSRINLKISPLRPHKLSLKLTREIGGRSYQSDIYGDGDLLGKIYFSRRPK